MNVISRLTLRHMRLNKKRTLVTVVGVAISVAMITAVTTFAASAIDLIRRDAQHIFGNWHAAMSSVPAGAVKELSAADGVKDVLVSRDLGYARLEETGNPLKPYLFVRELNEAGFVNLHIALVEGRLPQQPGEIVISQHYYINGGAGLNIGDKLTLSIGQRFDEMGNILEQNNAYIAEDHPDGRHEQVVPELTAEYTVTGIVSRPSWVIEPRIAPGYTAFAYLDPSALPPGELVDVKLLFHHVDDDIFAWTEELAVLVKTEVTEYNDIVLALYGVSTDVMVETGFAIIYTLALIAIIIIVAGSVSLIYNAFAISVSERSRHLGMLASVGATRGQKAYSVFFEGFAIGLAGIPLGLAAGLAGLGLTFAAINPIFTDLIGSGVALRLVVSPAAVLAAVVFSALTITVSAWIPARRAARVAPVTALRQTEDVRLTPKAVKTGEIARAVFGFEADLGLKNIKRYKSRYRATVFSLVISIFLYLTVSAYASYAAIGTRMFTSEVNYDVGVHLNGVPVENKFEFYRQIASLEWVKEHMMAETLPGKVYVDTDTVSSYMRKLVEPEDGTYLHFALLLTLDEQAYARYLSTIGLQGKQPGPILVNRAIVNSEGRISEIDVLNIDVGDVLRIHHDLDGEIFSTDIKIGAMADRGPLGSGSWRIQPRVIIVLPPEKFGAILTEQPQLESAHSVGLYLTATNPAALAEEVEKMHRESRAGSLNLDSPGQAAQHQRQMRFMITVFTTGFIVLITAICIANVFNTISANVSLRRREFAMLKSVGMTPRSFANMIRYESVFYGLRALAFGLPLSLAVNLLLYRTMSRGFAFAFTLPWASYLVVIGAVFVLVFATMSYASARIKKENIITSLKEENI